MTGSRVAITIARPVEDVFRVLTDVEQTARWFPWDVEEHWTSPPPHGIGSTRHAVVRMLGRTSENDAVVTEYDPPSRAAIRGTSPGAPFLAELDFGPAGEGTLVTVSFSFDFRGPARLVGPLFMRLYLRAWRRGLANLRQLMESGRL